MENVIEMINAQNTALVLLFVGLYGLSARRNIVKSIIALGMLQTAGILFFISLDSNSNSAPPIGVFQYTIPADPVPIAAMITVIIVGVSITALTLSMFISMYHRYATTNWIKVKNKRNKL